jgi:hypothetical protein
VFKTALKYGAILIGVYLAVEYSGGLSADTNAGSSGLIGLTQALQGRTSTKS